jgi:hypothetical protein
MNDTLQVALIAAAAAGGVGVMGLLALWLLRHRSLWVSLAAKEVIPAQ